MSKYLQGLWALILSLLLLAAPAIAAPGGGHGGGGHGGGGGGHMGGGSHAGGGFSGGFRSAPSMSRGPSVSRGPSMSRAPSINRGPSMSRGPAFNRSPSIGARSYSSIPRGTTSRASGNVGRAYSSQRPAISNSQRLSGGTPRMTSPGISNRAPGRSSASLNASAMHRPAGTRAGVQASLRGTPSPNQLNNFLGLRGGSNMPVAGRQGSGMGFGNHSASHLTNRPAWNNMRGNQLSGVNSSLAQAIRSHNHGNGNSNWNHYGHNHSQRWSNWGGPIRNQWQSNRNPWFNNGWWATHYVHRPYGYLNYYGYGYGLGGYGYRYGGYRPWSYWWGTPLWGNLISFGGYGWNSPCYYDYGPGGNVIYQSNRVIVDGTDVGSAADYAQSAADLATIDPNALSAEAGEWMPLGTFALTTSRDEKDPARVIQLAMDKQGIVSGTLFNKKTDKAYAISGRVDKETQRVAFRVDNASDLVFETGLYNLTQDQTPVLVHGGPDQNETYLMVRLDAPAESTPAAASGSPSLLEKLP